MRLQPRNFLETLPLVIMKKKFLTSLFSAWSFRCSIVHTLCRLEGISQVETEEEFFDVMIWTSSDDDVWFPFPFPLLICGSFSGAAVVLLTCDFEKFCKKSFFEAMCTSSAAFLFFSICNKDILWSDWRGTRGDVYYEFFFQSAWWYV